MITNGNGIWKQATVSLCAFICGAVLLGLPLFLSGRNTATRDDVESIKVILATQSVQIARLEEQIKLLVEKATP